MPYIPQIKIGNTTYNVKDRMAQHRVDAIANETIPIESGTFSDGDGITKNDNNKRLRNAFEIPAQNFVDMEMPSDFTMWVFMLDENKQLLGTLGVWVTYLNRSALLGGTKYINMGIKKLSGENSDISGYASFVESSCIINFKKDQTAYMADKSDRINSGYDSIDFQLGDLYVSQDGSGTYYSSASRLRTKANNPLYLQKGDIIGCYDYSLTTILIYKKNLDGTYTSISKNSQAGTQWAQQDTQIIEAGQYEIVARYPTEATITNAVDIVRNIFVKHKYGTLNEVTNITNTNDIYKSEIESVVSSVYNKISSRALVFGVVTDSHVDKNRMGWFNQALENLERLHNRLHFNGIIHLGDILNGYNTKAISKQIIQDSVSRFVQVAPDRAFMVVGNHDSNSGAGTSERFSDKELYGLIQRFNEHYVVRTMSASDSIYESQTSNYYVDYPSFKIRMIMFDSCYYSEGFSESMMSWIRSVMDSAPNDYKFVLWTHMSPEASLNAGHAPSNASTFKTLLAGYQNRIYCYIHGHSHYDYLGYQNVFADIALCSGVPDMPSQSVPSGGVQPSRTINSPTQDCISIVILLPEENKAEIVRFGAGSDFTAPFRAS